MQRHRDAKYCAENKLPFSLVFQMVNTLKMNRLVNYYEKQNGNLFSCCSKGIFNRFIIKHYTFFEHLNKQTIPPLFSASLRLCVSTFLLLVTLHNASAQFTTIPLNQAEQTWYENDLLRQKNSIHTAIYPLQRNETSDFDRRSELLNDSITKQKGLFNYIQRKLYHEHFLDFKKEDYHITLDPIIGFEYGQESKSPTYETVYQNSRGFHIEGRLRKKFSFYSTFVETQARFPLHLNVLTGQNNVVPGYWITKDFTDNAYDFAYAAGEIAYTPNKTFHFRLGRGKQFIGEGYRSLLISDNSVNYPFFRIETTIGKLRYVNLWSVMNDIRPAVFLAENVFAKKYLSMHYLSLNIGQRLNVGLFEGIMWGDELNRYGFDINFFNPVILFRPVDFAQGYEGGNILMGLNASYKIGHGIKIYGQMAVDEFNFKEIKDWSTGSWLNLFAFQAGAKWGDAFGVKNLFLRIEYNSVRPYVYSHRDVLTNWGHYAQPLAHPWGANFNELLIQAHYRKGRWQGRAAIHTGLLGRDENDDAHWGANIYKPYSDRSASRGVFVGAGTESQLLYWKANIAYLANPLYNLRLELGVQSRSEDAKEGGFPDSQSIYIGIRTNMYNLYQDF